MFTLYTVCMCQSLDVFISCAEISMFKKVSAIKRKKFTNESSPLSCGQSVEYSTQSLEHAANRKGGFLLEGGLQQGLQEARRQVASPRCQVDQQLFLYCLEFPRMVSTAHPGLLPFRRHPAKG